MRRTGLETVQRAAGRAGALPGAPKPSIACETISGTKCGQNRNDRRRMRTISFASVAAERKKTAGTTLSAFASAGTGSRDPLALRWTIGGPVSGLAGGRRRREEHFDA